MAKSIIRGTGNALALVAWLGIAVAPGVAQETPVKIGVVDVEVLVAESPQGKELQAQLERFQTEAQQEMQRMQEQAQAIQQRINDGANTLSEDRLSELNKELEDATIALRRYRDDKQRQGQKMQEEGLLRIEQMLQPVFEQARQELGLDLVINRVPGVVLMISDRVDITALMIERVNAATAAAPDAADSDSADPDSE